MQRDGVLYVRVSRCEQKLAREAAAAEHLRTGEFVRQAVRRQAQRVLGATRLRALLADSAIDTTTTS
jgi:uncharacterized protein (DUF1778 family)